MNDTSPEPAAQPDAPKTILIVDDEDVLRESLATLLEDEGHDVIQAANGKEAYDIVVDRPIDLMLSDVRMPEMDGMELLGHLQQVAPQMPVIILTAYGTVESAVSAMRHGAVDYLLKPVNFDDVIVKVDRALQFGEIRRTQQVMTEQLAAQSSFHDLIGESRAMQKLFDMVRKLAGVRSSVLILGESGTGKELFARAIHYNGLTRNKPFVAVNCGAIPDSLIESELFGHRKGSFTGAMKDKIGYFEAANGGTLFLDEISTLPLGVQSTLLRVLEEKSVVPVGDTRPRPVELRIVAATNRDLEDMVDAGEFREDLMYRLNVVKLELPPLRHRKEDIPLLVHHFLAKYCKEMNHQVEGMTNGAMRAMIAHRWRGNVRELENVIERAVIFAEGRHISVDDLPFSAGDITDDATEDLKQAMRQFERQHILQALSRHDFDKPATATALGIGVSSLYRKLEELDIPKNESATDESADRNQADEPAETPVSNE